MKKTFSVIISLLLIVALCFGVYWLGAKILNWFATLQSNVALGLLAASVTIFTSTMAIVLGRYFEGKKNRAEAHREKKVALYDEFTLKLFSIFSSADSEDTKIDEDLVPFLREIHRKLMLWSGPKVVKTYATWHRTIVTQGTEPKAEAMIGMVDFYLSLREDLGLSNQGIKRDHIIGFMLGSPDLFMSMYRTNPLVTMAEIAEKEQILKTISQQNA